MSETGGVVKSVDEFETPDMCTQCVKEHSKSACADPDEANLNGARRVFRDADTLTALCSYARGASVHNLNPEDVADYMAIANAAARMASRQRVSLMRAYKVGEVPSQEKKCRPSDAPLPDDAVGQLDRAADRMQDIERGHGGKVMRLRDLPTQYDELRSWISAKYGTAHILAVLDDEYARLKWYTRDSVIGVVVHLPTEKRPQGYIGATASSRAPNPGETWTRGNDLADGPYCRETWDRVVADAAFWDALPLEFDLRSRIERAADNATFVMVEKGMDPAAPGGDRTGVWTASSPQPE